jgi:hypothetical protein
VTAWPTAAGRLFIMGRDGKRRELEFLQRVEFLYDKVYVK